MPLSEHRPSTKKTPVKAQPFAGMGDLVDADAEQLVNRYVPKETKTNEPAPAFATSTPLTKKSLDPEYLRLALPSHFIFYPFKEMFYRTFDLNDLMKLYRAHVNAESGNGSYSEIIDIVNGACSEDVRYLTSPDFEFLMYRLRIDSYPDMPHEVPWTSRYGNVNKVKINNSVLHVVECDLTQAEYDDWQNQGFCVPTVRDQEYAQANPDWPEDEKWLFRQATFMQGNGDPTSEDYYASKLAALKLAGLPALSKIHQLGKKIVHGVEDVITTKDSQYTPEKALPKLQESIKMIKGQIALGGSVPESVFMLLNELELEAAEIHDWLTAKDRSKMVAPSAREETAKLKLDILSFFLDLQGG